MSRTLHNRILHLACWSLAASAIALAGCAESGNSYTIERTSVNGLPNIVATGKAWTTAKVEAIDYSNRSIALTDPDGTTRIFHISSAVVNFDQVKKGDTVKVEQVDRIAVNVRKVDEPAAIAETIGVEVAALGEKPGMVATRTVETNTTVTAIDYKARTISLKGFNGNITTLNVDPKVKNFDSVHVGDQVIFTLTEAISIQVQG